MRRNQLGVRMRGALLMCLGVVLLTGGGCDLLVALRGGDEPDNVIRRLAAADDNPFADREKVRERSRLR